MRRRSTHLLRIAPLVLAIVAAAAGPAGAVTVKTPAGQRLGVALRNGVAPSQIPGTPAAAGLRAGTIHNSSTGTTSGTSSSTDTGQLAYGGGPVLHSTAPYLVFWDPSGQVAASTRSLLARYLADGAADPAESDSVYGVNRQFTDAAGYAGASSSFSAAQQVISDSQPFPAPDTANCPSATGATTCLTDTQVQSELSRLLAADHLPSGTGADAPIYFVVLPPTVNECYQDGSTECASSTFCAYHSAYGTAAAPTLYSVIPEFPAAQSPKSCQWDGYQAVQQPNGDIGDLVLKYLSHEDSETITDPLGNGWIDPVSGAENGDECNAYGSSANPSQGLSPAAFAPALGGSAAAGTLYDQLIGGHPYYVQTEWSNGNGGCEARPSGGSLLPAFSTPGGSPGSLTGFSAAASIATLAITSATWSFGDGSPPQFVAGAGASAQHTYAAAGQYRVTLTLVDGGGNLASVSGTVSIGTPTAVTVSTPTPAPVAATVTTTPSVTLTTTTRPTTTTPTTTTPVKTRPPTGTITSGGRIATTRVRGGRLWVTLTGSGTLSFGGHRIHVRRGRTVGLRIALSAAQRRALRHHHRVRVVLRVAFAPAGGAVQRRTVAVTLHR